MDSKFSFTQKRLDELPTPATGRATYRDAKVPGLCIRVTATGSKSAYLSRKVNGRHLKYRLGTWPDDFGTVKVLRDAATDKLAEGLENVASQRRQKRHEPTVADLWGCWAKHMEAHKAPRSQAEDRRLYEKHLERWAARPLSAVKRHHVAALHARMGRQNGRYAANRLLSLASSMFNQGRREGLCEANPCTGIRKFKEEKRDRWLEGDELRRLFTALEAEPALFRDYFRLALLIGCRRSDLCSMRWQDVNLDHDLWRIPTPKGGVPIVVPLVPVAVAILAERLATADADCPWVFPSRSTAGHLVEPKTAWKRICERAGLADVRIHDLRRTVASWMAIGGASLSIVGKALGHQDGSPATAIYAKLSTDPVRAALTTATTAMMGAAGLLPAPANTEGPADDE